MSSISVSIWVSVSVSVNTLLRHSRTKYENVYCVFVANTVAELHTGSGETRTTSGGENGNPVWTSGKGERKQRVVRNLPRSLRQYTGTMGLVYNEFG